MRSLVSEYLKIKSKSIAISNKSTIFAAAFREKALGITI